ncbi:hypothetical protein JCM6882_008153 [Rhodosporidiobolus microsporus]
MTDHLIARFACRSSPASLNASPPQPATGLDTNTTVRGGTGGLVEKECAFCDIVRGRRPAFKVYEDDHTIAMLDILPIRPGHLLLFPKAHHQRIDDLPDDLAAHLGFILPRIARALCRATGQPDWNLVSNQGYAQTVPHVHYHLVPAPRLDPSPAAPSSASALPSSSSPSPRRLRLFSTREELDDDEGEDLARRIREELAKEGGRRAKL